MSWFFKKAEVRMQYEAPSFLSFGGQRFLVSEPKKASALVSASSPAAVVFVPGTLAFSSPRAWANAFANASYLVVLGKRCKELEDFMTALDRIIFSPVARKLSSALVAESGEEAERLLSSVRQEGFNEIMLIEGGNG